MTSPRPAGRRVDRPIHVVPLPRLLGWSGCLGVIAAVLHGLGRGRLSTPPLADPGDWSAWASGKDVPTIAFATLRLIAEGLAWYLLGLTVLHLIVGVTRSATLRSLARLLTAPGAGRFVAGVVGVTVVSTGLALGPNRAVRSTPGGRVLRTEPASMVLASRASGLDAGTQGTTGSLAPRLGRQWVEDVRPGQPGTATQWVDDPPAKASEPAAATWTVATGDHFWSIAARVLEQAQGEAPTDADITGYWVRLVESNRPSLSDPGNPDLLFTGQVLQLPPIE